MRKKNPFKAEPLPEEKGLLYKFLKIQRYKKQDTKYKIKKLFIFCFLIILKCYGARIWFGKGIGFADTAKK
ncbi:MAG: hypothetical protein Athens071425_645 [Parcubacteria group bacterium Athens0714_25]|nr:MAG: hypothetical protein Athens071425_645 [Parcubacteria group bacterium Athens0714_25]